MGAPCHALGHPVSAQLPSKCFSHCKGNSGNISQSSETTANSLIPLPAGLAAQLYSETDPLRELRVHCVHLLAGTGGTAPCMGGPELGE